MEVVEKRGLGIHVPGRAFRFPLLYHKQGSSPLGQGDALCEPGGGINVKNLLRLVVVTLVDEALTRPCCDENEKGRESLVLRASA